MSIKKYTKRTLIAALKEIRNRGWIKNHRNINNDGAIGNTLEDLVFQRIIYRYRMLLNGN